MAPTHNLNSAVDGMHHHVQMHHSNCVKTVDSVKSARTLQSVLRGEVPSAYIHLTSSYRTAMHDQRSPHMNSESEPTVPFKHVHREHENSFRPYQANSPQRTVCHAEATIQSRVITRSPKRTHSPFMDRHSIYGNANYYTEASQYMGQLYDRASPAYEDRSSPFQDSGSPFIGSPNYSIGSPSSTYSHYQTTGSPYSVHQNNAPLYSPSRTDSPYSPQGSVSSPDTTHENINSPYSGYYQTDGARRDSEGYSSESHELADDQPIDLSCKTELKHTCDTFTSDDSDFQDNLSNGSMLRTLLMPGKQVSTDYGSDSGRDSPGSDVYRPEIPVTGSTRVTLAKKMVYPITSRVSDWLVKIVQFSKSIPEFQSMSQNDKLTLLLHSWTRMLLLLMSENDHEFAVTPLHLDDKKAHDVTPSQEEPTMKSAECIQGFIRKCKNMDMDQKEYALMRMAVLFNSGLYFIRILVSFEVTPCLLELTTDDCCPVTVM